MKLNSHSSGGWTLIELTVAVTIFLVLLAITLRLSQSVSQQGETQDKATTTWTIAAQAASLLRNDVSSSIEMRLVNPKRLELKVIGIGEAFVQQKNDVIWEQTNSNSLCRIENNQRQEFNFSRVLNRGEEVSLKFRLVP